MTIKEVQRIRICGIVLLVILLSALPICAEDVVFQTTEQEEVVFQTTGNAISQFYTYSPSYTQTCAGSTAKEIITVKNQGTLPDTYIITIDAKNRHILDWITVSEESFFLKPGEQKEVIVYITAPYGTADSYEYTVHIASGYDSIKEIEKTLAVAECPNIEVKGYPSYQESCPCSTAVYVFSVSNKGTTAETYSLYINNIEPDYYELSEYRLTLQPHETKEVYAYIKMACFVYGDFDFGLIAETQNSRYIAELPLSLGIQQACYNYNINLGEALVFSENQTLSLDFTQTTDTNYILCQETPAVIPVQIQNPGEIMNEYSLKIEDAEEWISAAEPYIRLTKNKEHVTSIVVNTAAAETDTYSFALKADTLRGDLQSVIPFTIEIQDCTPEGAAPWLKYTLWTLLAVVILAILIAGYYLVKKPESKTCQAIKKHRGWLYWLLPLLVLFILLGLFAYPQVKELYGKSTIPFGEVWDSVETPFYHWVTALIVLGILLLIAALLWFFKFRKKRDGKNGKKSTWREKCTAIYEKIKPFLKWLWILLLLLLLLGALGAGGYYLYIHYKHDAEKFLEQNITNATEAMTTEISEQPDEAIEELKEQLAAVQEQIAEKEEEITALQEELLKIAEGAAVEENATIAEGYEARIQGLLDKIATLEEQLAALQQQETQLLAALGALDTKINAVDSHVTGLEERIASLEEQITALQNMIAQLSLEKANETIIRKTQQEIEELVEEKEEMKEALAEEAPSEEVSVVTDEAYETTLIFDVSISGQIVEDCMSRFLRGIEAAEKYVQEKGIYNVMIIGKNPIMIRRDANKRDTLRTIHMLRPLDTQSNLGTALYKAAEDFHSKKGRIVLISDMQTTDNTDLTDIHDVLEEQGFDVVFIDISFKKPAPVEEGEEESEAEEQLAPYFSVETQTAGSFQIDIPMNSDYTVDLSTYFSDEDNDVLTYTAKAGEHLYAAIKESLAILSPERDWTGKTNVIFGADDGKGGYVESPALAVNVFAQEESPEETIPAEEGEELNAEVIEESHSKTASQQDMIRTYIPWIIIGSIILLIVGSVIIGAFVKRFQKQ